MRSTMVILTIIQLLLRGVAVSHCHAHESLPSAADHAQRPHIHVAGHSHSSDRNAERYGHSHRHDSHDEMPAPTVPSPNHDQSALYIGCDVLTAAVERVELPATAANSMFDSDFCRLADSSLPQTVAYSEIGPPKGSIFAPLVVLPHMLRL